jgi:hypothetical protein
MALADEIGAIRVLTELAKWEGSIRGKWPQQSMHGFSTRRLT